MRHTITDFEFGQLKHFFDQNDQNGGANFLNQLLEQWQEDQLLEQWQEDLYKKDYSSEILYHLPFECGEGIELEYNVNNHSDKPVLRIQSDKFEVEAGPLDEVLGTLNSRILELESMHSNAEKSLKHIPTIISTKEQYEEMKPQMDKNERVLVHTTFDKALTAL